MSAGTTYGAWANKHLKMEKTKVDIFEEAIADFGLEAALEYFSVPEEKRGVFQKPLPAPSVKASEAAEESTWEIVLRRMKHKNLFDDKFNPNTLEFAYAFQMGFKAAGTQWGKEADQAVKFAEWIANSGYVAKRSSIHFHVWIWRIPFLAGSEVTTEQLYSTYLASTNKNETNA